MSKVLEKVKADGGLDGRHVNEKQRKSRNALRCNRQQRTVSIRIRWRNSVRSEMNVVFTMANEDMEKKFIAEAKEKRMIWS